MADRKSNSGKRAAAPKQIAEKADRRFAAADGQIAELKEQGAEERRSVDRSKKKGDA
jgi:hypothetical protein